jgi:signal transduction histidine kinase
MREVPQPQAHLLREVASLRQQLAVLTHDISDPLGVILGYTDMLLKEASMQDMAWWVDRLERIQHSALAVHALVLNSRDSAAG